MRTYVAVGFGLLFGFAATAAGGLPATAPATSAASGQAPGGAGPNAAGTQPDGAGAAVTSRTDPFLKLLRDRLDVKLAQHFTRIVGTIDWPDLRQEAAKADAPADKAARLAYVELWKRLADAYDYGSGCQRPHVFEWKACQLLAGTHVPEGPLPYADLGLTRQRACDYLLAEDLPAWARSLRLCAAGVLTGEGDRRGPPVLLEAIRVTVKDPGGFEPVHEALRATWTEKALPLWVQAARDADAKVRLVVLANVDAVKSDKAVPILLALLKDDDREVRTAAAVALMRRDVKDAAAVLKALNASPGPAAATPASRPAKP